MSKAKVLVVDDELDVVKTVSMRLKTLGYDVITAMDGLEATSKAMQEGPDVIILDIGMPAGDGHIVAERLKSSAKTCLVPIIFLTARTSVEDQQKAFKEGVEKYITKPFDPQELILAIEAVLRACKELGGGTDERDTASGQEHATDRAELAE